MKLKYQPDDPHLLQTLLGLANGAVEGPGSNYRIQIGKVTLTCTANTLASKRLTFATPYLQGTVPFVLTALSSPSVTTASVTVSSTGESSGGFAAQALSTANQTVTVVYVAIGQTG